MKMNPKLISTVASDIDYFPQILHALLALGSGDFSARLPDIWTGIEGKIADAFNDISSCNSIKNREILRVSSEVGKRGRLKRRLVVTDARGGWAEEVEAINTLIDDLVWPTIEITRVIGAVAKGDLSQSVGTEVEGHPLQGEFLRASKTVNSMVEQLAAFTAEVTRVAREVGTEGKLGGQAQVKGSPARGKT